MLQFTNPKEVTQIRKFQDEKEVTQIENLIPPPLKKALVTKKAVSTAVRCAGAARQSDSGCYSLDGKSPHLHEDSWVAPTASVIGNVKLEKDASVWFGAVIRGDSSQDDSDQIVIGEGSNIQDNCVCHSDAGTPLTIGKNVTVGHMVMLHGCTIGDNSLIGIGAIVLNGVVIGKNCIIGANSFIGEGKVIPDNSLVMG